MPRLVIPEKKAKAFDAIRAGKSPADASRISGVPERTIQGWLKKGSASPIVRPAAPPSPSPAPFPSALPPPGISPALEGFNQSSLAGPPPPPPAGAGGLNPALQAIGVEPPSPPAGKSAKPTAPPPDPKEEADFCIKTIGGTKAMTLAFMADVAFKLDTSHAAIGDVLALQPQTVEIIRANAVALAPELRKAVGSSLYVVYAALGLDVLLSMRTLWVYKKEGLHVKRQAHVSESPAAPPASGQA